MRKTSRGLPTDPPTDQPYVRYSRALPWLRASCYATAVCCALLLLLPSLGRSAASSGTVAAATEHPLSTKAAIEVMEAGGNAVDAAIASVLVAGVVNPTSSGIGGGGFALVWKPGLTKPYVLDFREVAPRGINPAAFQKRPFQSEARGQAVGVPGEVAGLIRLHERFGTRPWAELVEPAKRYAEQGFPVGQHLASSLAAYRAKLTVDSGIAQVYYPGGKPAGFGTRLRNLKLAKTLARIAKQGRSAFYSGPVAKDIAQAVQSHGGSMQVADLAAYRVRERKPLHVQWAGHDVYTMPPPSAGGLMLAQTLRLFSKQELQRLAARTAVAGGGAEYERSGAYQHALAEAMRGAIADRMRYLGDPDVQNVAIERLYSPSRMERRKQRLQPDLTHWLPRFGLEEHGTHHLSFADAEGMAVALTTTVNHSFGSKIMAPASGVVLNDELDDFTSQKHVKAFGLKRSPNRPRPGVRPVSSMTPTIAVRNGRAVLTLGGSGGLAIATNVTQLAVAHLAFGNQPEALVAAQRFFVPPAGATIQLHPKAPAEVAADLRWRGELVGEKRFLATAVQVITAGPEGHKRAAADPRKHGTAETATP